jgi:ABC-type transport system involved in multi-copper enzyme maturation permease subunit
MQKIMLKNPVFLKDISIKAKRSRMAVSLFVINVLASLVAIFILFISNAGMVSMDPMDLQAFTWIFDGFIIVECAFVCLMVPSETGPSIANERERQTLDVLLTTKMSHFDIILGKYLSSVAYTLLLLVSLLPFLSVVLIYGSISFIQLVGVMLAVIETVMYLSAFGILYSTLVKKSSRASASALAVVFLLVFGTIFLCLIIHLIAAAANSGNYYNGRIFKANIFNTGDFSFFLLYFNPATTVFDVLDKIVGFDIFSDNYHGMAGIIAETSSVLTPDNFFVKHWAPVGFVVQIITAFYMLKLSAAKLAGNTRRVKLGKKNNN